MRRTDDVVAFHRVQTPSTPALVVNALRAAILDGTLAPGSKLFQSRLAADLGVSRGPLREALVILADDGLVVHIPNRGAFVAQVGERSMAEIASVRKRLEPWAIERALPRLRGVDREDVTRPLRAMAGAADRGDVVALIDAHMLFHRAIYALAEYALLLDLWRSWESQLQLFFSAHHHSLGIAHEVVTAHERLLQAIDTGDGQTITGEVERHVDIPRPTRPRL